MTHKNMNAKEITNNSKGTVYKGGITGGIIGAGAGFILSPRISVPEMSSASTVNPVYIAIAGAILGAFTGVILKSLYRLNMSQNKTLKDTHIDEARIELREEELVLQKKRVQTGNVTVHKEILKEEKNITVPVTREELVIEKSENSKGSAGNASDVNETIRIPIREEQIEVVKHPVTLEDVLIYKQQTQDIEHIEETLKKEKLRVKTTGDVNVSEDQLGNKMADR